jgi:hypothetical protein
MAGTAVAGSLGSCPFEDTCPITSGGGDDRPVCRRQLAGGGEARAQTEVDGIQTSDRGASPSPLVAF